jgi:stage V sporulation protein D (sporulation-specific penicillin-binding protein)
LQLVRAISAVVNGGYLVEPYIVSEVVDADENTVLKQETTVVRQVISKETSDTMRLLMQSVVEQGTAKNASVAGYSIGGKTGTSEKIDVFDANGQRVLDKIVSFVGVAPMENPEYIVLVALDTPSRQTGIYISGGVMAAPTVGAVMEDILPYLGVQKDPNSPEGQLVIMPDCVGMSVKEAEKHLKDLGLAAQIQGGGDTVTAQIPTAGQSVPGASQVILYAGEVPQVRMTVVPDFTGMNRQQASDAAGKAGLYILVAGNDRIDAGVVVTEQSEPKNTEVPVGSTVRLTFADTKAAD